MKHFIIIVGVVALLAMSLAQGDEATEPPSEEDASPPSPPSPPPPQRPPHRHGGHRPGGHNRIGWEFNAPGILIEFGLPRPGSGRHQEPQQQQQDRDDSNESDSYHASPRRNHPNFPPIFDFGGIRWS